MIDVLIFFVGAWAGAQNALAGGGSFLILPTLMLSGLDARAANVTSCVALFPAQIATGWTGRALAAGANGLSLKVLFAISVVGGGVGAVVLLITPSAFFSRLLPWLVLFATLIFAWGSFFRKKTETPRRLSARGAAAVQFLISVYGGYFGGGIGFMMMAALTLAGQNARVAGATKNVLAGVINAAAVAIFLFAPDLHMRQAVTTSLGAVIGGVVGAKMLHHIDEKILRVFVVIIGGALTVGLFYRAA
ncbi:sulfite exporter TauE/SafE family protein [Methylocystis heyeri]|uniref:Probable membrane transporter protein n=1 Tax=Methylocystis heyeri TaxID=391905 RepID=A0A6B8KK45_9HYPH|nr:sulfite exporter TauE/SafE family protein [Methylocystis heyeri]QGM46990.1 TSUP family transporter [Methylocystis heyeri]